MSRINAIVSRTTGEEPREPWPPGTRRTSRAGALVKVWVGTTFWPIPAGYAGVFVLTGSRVEASTDRVIDSLRERSFRQFRGPKASRASKPGYRAIPMRRGSGLELELVSIDSLVFNPVFHLPMDSVSVLCVSYLSLLNRVEPRKRERENVVDFTDDLEGFKIKKRGLTEVVYLCLGEDQIRADYCTLPAGQCDVIAGQGCRNTQCVFVLALGLGV